ncbi:hypothetical protein IP84_01565 [beta proteobacterium AAP99]|nr:hypothetical protein IP84_01565 [beta proteobacterium AAP99]
MALPLNPALRGEPRDRSGAARDAARGCHQRAAFWLAGVALSLLAACGGGQQPRSDVGRAPGSPPPAAAAPQVRTVNALDDAAVTQLKADGTTLQTATVDVPVTDLMDMPRGKAMTLDVAAEQVSTGTGTATQTGGTLSAASLAAGMMNTAEPGDQFTVIATGDSSNLKTITARQNAADIAADQTGLRVLHAAPRVPAVDIYLTAPDAALPATPSIPALAFTNFAPPADQPSLKVPAGDYQIRITQAGARDVVFDSGKLALPGGQDVLVAAIPAFEGAAPVALLVLPSDGKPTLIRAPSTALRAVHLSPEAPAVDVLANDRSVIRSLAFREDSRILNVAPGAINLKVNAAGTSTTVINADLTLPARKAVSVIALNKLAAIEPVVIVDDGTKPAMGKAKLRVLHAAPDVPAVDVYLTAPDATDLPAAPTIPALAFKAAFPAGDAAAVAVDAGLYRVRITVAGQRTVVFDSGRFGIWPRDDLLLAAVPPKAGSPAQASPVDLLVVRARGFNQLLRNRPATMPPTEPPVMGSKLRALHASPEAPAVDILVDDAKAIENLSFGTLSPYKAAPEGNRSIKVNVAGSSTNLLSATLPVEKDAAYTVVAYDLPTALKALVLKDETRTVFAGARGYIRIANLISNTQGAPTFTGSSTGGSVAFGTASPYGENSPGSKTVGVSFTTASGTGSASVAFNLEEGNSYTVYAIGSADPAKNKPVRLFVSRDSAMMR